MAARFPQSGTSLAWRIKPAWASKIAVLYWAAASDSVHRLRSADSSTNILTRTTTGATFNSTEGRLSGTSGTTLANHFTDSVSGGYTSSEANDFSFGFGIYGDLFNGATVGTNEWAVILGTDYANMMYPGGFVSRASVSNVEALHKSGGGIFASIPNFSALSPSLETVASRYVATDPVATTRSWINGSEDTAKRAATGPAGTMVAVGTATNPLVFGNSQNGGAGKIVEWEFAWFGNGTLSDQDMADITANPAILIEATPAGITLTGSNSTQAATSGTGTVTVSSTPVVNLVGSSSTQSATSGTGAISTTVGTLTSSPMKSFFTGLPRPNVTGIGILVYDKTGGDTGDKTAKLTGQANNASAIWSGSSPLYVAGRAYRLVYTFSDGSEGMETVIAT
jgi:hypothetical protein